jgi:hypothetical protein
LSWILKAAPLKVIDLVGQGDYDGKLDRGRFFKPSSVTLREWANEGLEARFMVLIVEPGFTPSLERSFSQEIMETTTGVSLKAWVDISRSSI